MERIRKHGQSSRGDKCKTICIGTKGSQKGFRAALLCIPPHWPSGAPQLLTAQQHWEKETTILSTSTQKHLKTDITATAIRISQLSMQAYWVIYTKAGKQDISTYLSTALTESDPGKGVHRSQRKLGEAVMSGHLCKGKECPHLLPLAQVSLSLRQKTSRTTWCKANSQTLLYLVPNRREARGNKWTISRQGLLELQFKTPAYPTTTPGAASPCPQGARPPKVDRSWKSWLVPTQTSIF